MTVDSETWKMDITFKGVSFEIRNGNWWCLSYGNNNYYELKSKTKQNKIMEEQWFFS